MAMKLSTGGLTIFFMFVGVMIGQILARAPWSVYLFCSLNYSISGSSFLVWSAELKDIESKMDLEAS